MASRWDEYPEASLADYERRCSRPGARNYAALEALDNYQRELDSNRERDRYFRTLERKTATARAAMKAAHGEDE